MSTGPVITKSIVEDIHDLIKNTPQLKTAAEKEQFKTIVNQQNGLEKLSEDMTPLFCAVQHGRIDHIEVLIGLNADFTRKCQYKSITDFVQQNELCVKMCKTIRDGVKNRGGPEGVKENFNLQKIEELFEKEKRYDPEELFATITTRVETMTKFEITTKFEKSKEANKDYILFSFRDPVTDELMEYPGKFDNCRHLACFDVKAFIFRNKAEFRKPRPYLKCPMRNCPLKTTKVSSLNIVKYFSTAFDELGKPEKMHLFRNGTYIDPHKTKGEDRNTDSAMETESPAAPSLPEGAVSQQEYLSTVKSDPDALLSATSTSQASNVEPVTVFELSSEAVPPATRVSPPAGPSRSPEVTEVNGNANNAPATEASETAEVLTPSNGVNSTLNGEKENDAPCAKELEIERLTKIKNNLEESYIVCNKALRQSQAETQKRRKIESELRHSLMKCQNDRMRVKKECQAQVRDMKGKMQRMEKELNTLKRRSSNDEGDVQAELVYAKVKIMKYEAEREQLRGLLSESTMLQDLLAVKNDDSEGETLALPATDTVTLEGMVQFFMLSNSLIA